ncbi:MAG: PilT/PilU family type 4a pilus ATPase [Trueperaceae bacterium]|nr:PilT/PilU family type 4a pilus ATPase [Trueperaceae bacterium]MCC6311314.1 PilT/PilU family type 4a pilus ATPase [Trueperaceae bacterium]MCO5174052.1 PilT/PilU family type 4a pilus ATPase [Trueperaceae bacterium]MCW5820708.1 PilT/PilU family type 4a pilus ATPase [Trueperaceae bacterium]
MSDAAGGRGIRIADVLRNIVAKGASDIHLQAGAPPYMRVDGELYPFEGVPTLTPEQTEQIALAMMSESQREVFRHRHEVDFAFTIPNIARFRCNVLRQRGSVGVVMRVIRDAIPSFESLGLPTGVVTELVSQPRGLVLVTGPTGSGKTTTLAAMIDFINRRFARNIITIEDPIEILHRNQKSLVIQREIGLDTADFVGALKFAMRQDPDVIMVGEMRDKETVEAAISAAQTGHLVFSTLHTLDAIRTVNRIIDFFPPHERDQIRILLAESLLGIFSQRLLARADEGGRVLALELLINTPLIRDYIKDEEKTPLIKEALMQDNLRGMQTFDQHLVELYLAGRITMEDATFTATSPHEFRLMVTQRQGGVGSDELRDVTGAGMHPSRGGLR